MRTLDAGSSDVSRVRSKRPAAIDAAQVPLAVAMARRNWCDWRPVYAHEGPVAANPLLANREWFGCFLWEYAVARTVGLTDSADPQAADSVERARQLQRALRDSAAFTAAVERGDSDALMAVGAVVSERHSAKGTRSGLFSLLSKVAALCNPAAFMASDRYARCGLSMFHRGTKGYFDADRLGRFPEYQRTALAFANAPDAWPGDTHRTIVHVAESLRVEYPIFALRVLDCLCMEMGRIALQPGIGARE